MLSQMAQISFFWLALIICSVHHMRTQQKKREILKKAVSLVDVCLMSVDLQIVWFNLEVALWMVANWTYLRSFLTDNDVSTVAALPYAAAIA